MSRFHIVKNINKLLRITDFQIVKQPKGRCHLSEAIRINIGSGDWSSEGWINLDYPSEWYCAAQRKHKIIPYDIRNDRLPYENDSVDLIYCSHVIEHIENKYIATLFDEMFRVLKKNGGGRICCPDAEFLYQVTKASGAGECSTDYWNWRKDWFESSFYQGTEPRLVDYLVREIATPKLLHYKHGINTIDYIEQFEQMSMFDFFEYLVSDLSFREDCVGDHINYWTFEKVEKMLRQSGFKTVIRSKWSGSMFGDMQNLNVFDVVFPNMSLYIEFVK